MNVLYLIHTRNVLQTFVQLHTLPQTAVHVPVYGTEQLYSRTRRSTDRLGRIVEWICGG